LSETKDKRLKLKKYHIHSTLIMIKRLTILLFSALAVWAILSYVAAYFASYPNPVQLPPPDKFFDVEVEEVNITAKGDVNIAGWYIKGDSTKAVVLANGIRGNRSGLIDRAKLYAKHGFGVLLIDLRGTGESDPEPITYGWNERHDIHAARDFLRKKGYKNIGTHGISLGAASIIYGLQEQPDDAFMVLESCYGSVQEALDNRLEMKNVPKFTTLLMQRCNECQLGIKTEQLRPVDYISSAQVPVLMIAGDREKRVKRTETETLYQRCGSTQKRLHYIKGATHIDLYKFAPKKYEKVWTDFMQNTQLIINDE